jgi:CRP/FNR family transcriptional regulator, cyclic AMP receptor protein
VHLFSQDAKVEALRGSPLFHGLARSELAQVAKETKDVELGPGRVLCEEGETAREFFVILDGEVEVTKAAKRLATLGPGDFFGEIALVEHSTRTATVTATTPVRFFVLTSGAFSTLLDHNPGVERKVLRALAKRVVGSDDPTA